MHLLYAIASYLLFLVGIPLYGFLKARRERLGLVAPPVEASEMPAAELVDITTASGEVTR